tara:strand:- start:2856 stop:4547 length:1692 start_codon:yes stop_codon:yes gene_type:complete
MTSENSTLRLNDINDSLREDTIDLYSLIQIFKRNIKSITFIILTFLILSLIYAFKKKPLYEGQFQIVLSSKKQNSSLANINNDVANLLRLNENLGTGNNLKTEIEILRSPSVLMPIFKDIKNFKITNGDLPKNSKWKFGSWRKNYLNVDLKKSTSILDISYIDYDKDLILKTLNQIVKTYKDYSGIERRENINRVINYLKDQVEIYREKSINSLKEAQLYSEKYNLTLKSPLVTNIEFIRSNSINKIKEIESLMNQLYSIPDESNEILNLVENGISNNINSKILLNSLNKTSQLFLSEEDLKEKYTENDKLVKLVKKKKLIALNSLKREFNNYLKASKIYYQSILKSVERPDGVLIKYKELQNQSIIDQKTLTDLENRLSYYSLEKAKAEKPWKLITNPTLSDKPISPNKKLVVIMGLFSGFIFGSLRALIMEYKNQNIYNKKIIEDNLDFPLLYDLRNIQNNDKKDIFTLIANNSISLQKNNELVLIFIGEISNYEIESLKEIISDLSLDKKIIFSRDIVKTMNYQNRILIFSLGKIKKEQLLMIRNKLFIQKNEVIGWLLI